MNSHIQQGPLAWLRPLKGARCHHRTASERVLHSVPQAPMNRREGDRWRFLHSVLEQLVENALRFLIQQWQGSPVDMHDWGILSFQGFGEFDKPQVDRNRPFSKQVK